MNSATAEVAALIESMAVLDPQAELHHQEALTWLASTDDIWRRGKPDVPSPHLVSYFLLVDREQAQVLLCAHRLSGLWLPTGGHVEPNEHPVATVRREAQEELGIDAVFDPVLGEQPFLLTVTETVGDPRNRHTDVSLWFALAGHLDQPLVPDGREFHEVRWWTPAEIGRRDPERFDPHMDRALTTLGR